MYKVMIVDDEPAAITYLSAIIKKRCSDFMVTSTAVNGKEALEKVVKDCPDILLFDIQMPLLNGLEMAQKIQELELPTLMVAVSGYSQFDYAVSAMKNGVVDYLLKPVMTSEVEKLFKKLKRQLQQRYFQEYVDIMRGLCNGENVPREKVLRYFGSENYYIALARKNGLPMRFSSVQGKEVYSDIHEIIYAYGRDEHESLYMWPEILVINDPFRKLVSSRMEKDTIKEGYYTLIYSSVPVGLDNLAETIKKLYNLLDRNIVLGKNSIIDICNYQEPRWNTDNLEKKELQELIYCMGKFDNKHAKEHLENVIKEWELQERPLLWIERRIRQLSSSLLLGGNGNYDKDYQLNEYVLEDVFRNSYTFTQLLEGISNLLFPSAETIQKEEKLDTSEFVDRISNFMETYMDKNINVQLISKEFSISPTYLGKLFRKYKNMSMNSFLTSIRIERAKEILQQNPNIMIRELAQHIGYRDQFYFSRVFRSYTGVSPSEYSLNIMENK